MTIIRTLAVVVLALGFAGATLAEEITDLGTFTDWSAYKFQEGGSDVCYMATQPAKSEGDYTKRGQVFWLVAHRTAFNKKNTSSFVPGYTLRPDSSVSVEISGRTFTMFAGTEAENQAIAWFRDQDDSAAVEAMRKGLTMIVKAVSSRGTLTTDEFSLRGFTAAHNKITEACGF
jgi:invasion protein IalB